MPASRIPPSPRRSGTRRRRARRQGLAEGPAIVVSAGGKETARFAGALDTAKVLAAIDAAK